MSYNKILIIRTDRIGDIILSTPVIEAVRKACPNAHIAFMTSPYTRDIVSGNPCLDEVIIYDKKGKHNSFFSAIKFISDIRKKRFDLALILHSTNRANLIAFLAGIPKRVGYSRRLGWLLTDRLPYLKYQGLKHEMEYTLDIVRLAGISFNEQGLKPFIPVNKDAEENIARFCKENGLNKDNVYAGMHVSASCPSKRWTPQKFSEAADRIIGLMGCKIVILGVGGDLEIAEQVKSNMKNNVVIAKNFTLAETIAFIKSCKFFVATDSGPAHIAGALGVPCVTIFGRNQPGLGPARWRPMGKNVIVLHKDVGCTECLAHMCKRNFICLESITVNEVVDAARKLNEDSNG